MHLHEREAGRAITSDNIGKTCSNNFRSRMNAFIECEDAAAADAAVATVSAIHWQGDHLSGIVNGAVGESGSQMQIEPSAESAVDHGFVQWGSGGGQVQVRDIPAFNTMELRQCVDFRDI